MMPNLVDIGEFLLASYSMIRGKALTSEIRNQCISQ